MKTAWEDAVGEVRRRADIVEIISEAVVLKRAGRNYVGLCPFHGERTPSFNVNPERQIFRCFGCGEGGDVFSFMMKHDALSFPEVLERLAERVGYELPARKDGVTRAAEADLRARIKEANEAAQAYFRAQLEAAVGAEARAYLEGRGIGPELAARFGLGFAPPGWDGLAQALARQGLDQGLLEQAALVRPRPSGGGAYDVFRRRVTFPIHNETGVIVGFGGRAIAPEDEPKYLNSPETPVYHKGHVLYGLYQAAASIKAKDEALLMEGYLDVITAHAYGFTQAVGVLGTALTPAQAKLLLRYTPSKRVVLAFDADRAGQAAAERGLATLGEVARGVGLTLRVVAVPDGKDPDAYLRRHGAPAFGALMAEAQDVHRFLLDRALAGQDPGTPEGLTAAMAAVTNVLLGVESPALRDALLLEVARRLNVREEALRLEVKRRSRPGALAGRADAPRPGHRPLVPPSREKPLSRTQAERLLLHLMVEHPSVRAMVAEQLADVPFEAPQESLRGLLAEAAGGWDAVFVALPGGSPDAALAAELAFMPVAEWDRPPERLAADCIDTLRYRHLEAELAGVRLRLAQAGKAGDGQAMKALAVEMTVLSSALVALDQKRRNLTGAGRPASEA